MIIMIANFHIMRVHKEGLSYLKFEDIFILFQESDIKSEHHFLALISWQEGGLTMRGLHHERVEIGPRGGSLSVLIRRVRSGERWELAAYKLNVFMRTGKHDNYNIYSSVLHLFNRSSLHGAGVVVHVDVLLQVGLTDPAREAVLLAEKPLDTANNGRAAHQPQQT